MHKNRQGSGLLAVLIILTATAIVVFSLFSVIDTETRLNHRAELYHEAKQAVESLIQTGIADVHARSENSSSLDRTELMPSVRPLSFSPDFLTFHNESSNQSNIVVPSNAQYISNNQFLALETAIIGSEISPSRATTIDASEIGNESDPDSGRRLRKRTVEILGKATVSDPLGSDISVYASQYLEIRKVSLYSHAIFYNLPMEIAPGDPMDIYDRIHVNGDAWFQSSNGAALNLHGLVTVSGNVYHGRRKDENGNIVHAEKEKNGKVSIADDSNNLVNMQEDASWTTAARNAFIGNNNWLDSNSSDSDFIDSSFKDLREELWDGNLQTGVPHVELPGIKGYVEGDDPTTPEVEEYSNSAYTIIQPTLNKIELPDRNADPEGYAAAKALKTSEKNKFSYMAGLTIEVDNSGNLSYYSYKRDTYGDIQYNNDGSPQKDYHTPTIDFVTKEIYTEEDGNITSGLYDKRQEQGMNLIEIDVSKLKDMVHANDETAWGGQVENKPEEWWEGVVYVQFPQVADPNRVDNVIPASSRNWGVKLKEGDVIPNPAFSGNNGTTFATNQVMYVQGHYNADGTITNDSPTQPDNASEFNQQGKEAPSALVADAITFLSESWSDENSNKDLGEKDDRNSDLRATPTEVSAAILAGIVPSDKDGNKKYSGGVENFPRFLEHWKDVKFAIRGSMVAMFESEVATEPWGKSGVYFRPIRAWGFHSSFTETPPIGPEITSYRARDMQLISQSDYEARVNANFGP